jgi:hypothetical protein
VADLLIEWMKKHNVPITRQNYLDLAYGKGAAGSMDAGARSRAAA